MKYDIETTRGIYKRIVGAMSGLSKIDVNIVNGVCPNFCPDTNIIEMPSGLSYCDDDDEMLEISKGIVVHEAGHVLFAPDTKNHLKKYHINDQTDMRDFLEWLNVFLDSNNEYKVTKLFPHLKCPLIKKTKKILEKHPDKLSTDNPFIQVLLRVEQLQNLKYEFPQNYPLNLRKFVEEVSDDFNKDKIYSVKGSKVLEFTQKTFDKWKILRENHKKRDPNGAIEKLMKELSKAIQGKDAEKVKEIEKEIENMQNNNGWFKDTIPNVLLPQLNANTTGKFSEKNIDELKAEIDKAAEEQAKASGKKGSPPATDKVKIVMPEDLFDEKSPWDDSKAILEGRVINRRLRENVKLGKIFAERHRSGKVDMSEVLKQVSQFKKITTQKVFHRKDKLDKGGEWAVSVLLDVSGSMSGDMYELKTAAATLNNSFKGIPGLFYEINAFCSNDDTLIMPLKTFNSKLQMNSLEFLMASGGTPTSTALQVSINNISLLPRMRKIIVVVTDGSPCNYDNTIRMRKQAEGMGITVVGVGLGFNNIDSFKRLFPNFYNFSDSKQLIGLTQIILDNLKVQKSTKFVKSFWRKI